MCNLFVCLNLCGGTSVCLNLLWWNMPNGTWNYVVEQVCWNMLNHCLLVLNLCVCMMAWLNCVWFMTCDENVVDDGLADIYVYYAFMSCDERSVCHHWIWLPRSSWMRGQFVTPYSHLKMSLTTIQNKTKSRRHKIHILIYDVSVSSKKLIWDCPRTYHLWRFVH